MVFGLFRKRIDPKLLDVAGGLARNRFRESLENGCSIYCTDIDTLDRVIRNSPDAQLMVLAVLRPTLNYSLQDAYFSAGKIMYFEKLPAEPTNDEERRAIRAAMTDLPTCKSNVDMRFRYMFVDDISTAAEDALWNEMVIVSEKVVRQSFEQKRPIASFWVGVIERISEKDANGAREILKEFA